MSEFPSQKNSENPSSPFPPSPGQLGRAGAISGLVTTGLIFIFSQSTYDVLRWEGLGALIIYFLFLGISFVGGFLGGVLVRVIAKAVIPKPASFNVQILYFIVVVIGTIIGWVISLPLA